MLDFLLPLAPRYVRQLLPLTILFSVFCYADDDNLMHHGRGGRRGNESSEHVRDLRPGRQDSGGSGCPSGSMNIVMSPDNLSFSVLFNQFIASTSANTRRMLDRKDCQVRLPLAIPADMQLEITRVDYRGFLGLPLGAKAELRSQIRFQSEGKPLRVRFEAQGEMMEDFEISTGDISDRRERILSSKCGEKINLILDTQIRVQVTDANSATASEAQIALDSMDGKSQAEYFLNWRKCERRRLKVR